MRLFDSHAHLNLPEFAPDRKNTLSRAREVGVERVMNIGLEVETSRIAREMAEEDKHLFAAAAVHPSYLADAGEDGFAEVCALLREGGFRAVGETGLDYHWDHSPRELQRDFFRRHLSLAGELDLPVVIHCRNAQEDCLRMLREESEGREIRDRVIMHCFGGDADDARAYVAMGCYVSFAGNLTFKNAHELREAAAVVPLERTLIETDCPYLAPQPKRGRKNEPAYVVHTAHTLAEVHGIPVAEAARTTFANTCRVFGIEE